MLHKALATLAAAAIMAFAVLPADAAKKAKRYRAETRTTTVSPSLDGRITGRSRTCGYATFQYDGLGVPHGPYCH